jgi:hypothetical protein
MKLIALVLKLEQKQSKMAQQRCGVMWVCMGRLQKLHGPHA